MACGPMKPHRVPAIFSVLVLCQCGTPSPPACRVQPRESRGDVTLQLEQARAGWQAIAAAPDGAGRERAVANYNMAVAKLVDRLRCGPGTYREKAGAMGTVIDESRTLGAGIRLEDLDGLIPASAIPTDAIGKRHRVDGIGVSLVGWKKTAEEGAPRWEFEPPTGVPLNLTAVLDFTAGRAPQWRFRFPGKADPVELGGRKIPLAADWSAPSAFYWQMSDLDDLDLAKVFLPSRFTEETKLYVASPYDPRRIPVVLVHGLYSSPGTFKKLYNELNREAWFRENYQVWFYSYPTGTNWTFNAARFRQEMKRADQHARAKGPVDQWERMVVIGHSMGGVITHASLKKPGDRLYHAFQERPLEQLTENRQTREAVRELTMYEPMATPERVIFLAAPHRGSPSADRFFSNWISKLIRLPKKLTVDLVDLTLNDFGSVLTSGETSADGWFTSIGSLSPSYPAYEVLHEVPFRDGLKVHSIIGDRGMGNSPDSSDGIVPYWSSHLGGVESEKIVPFNHSVPACPDCAEEVKRILKLHLDGVDRPRP